ncbi:MAG TPA: thioesterase family protein [Phycisphaerae bacterium]|nr:acyl-CoA thioesterase [Phycisphaerales bacterium]HRX85298.1 thioesterase family protein [Phycisphaerae bacterium]
MNPLDQSEVQVRVRYAECDPMGLLHHAKYFEYLELSRTELLRASGVSYRELEARGVFFVVAKLEIRYKAPIRYDDVVIIHTRVERITRTRVDHSYRMLVNGVVCTEASSTLACVDTSGRPILMPENLWPDDPTEPRP